MSGLGASQAMRQRRAVVARNLTRIDPTLRGPRLERAIRATFDSYARYWVDSFRLPYLSKEEVDAGFAFQGYGRIPLVLREGKGCILALPHLGGWEWAGRWMADRGHQLTVVVEPIEPPELFDFFVDFRKSLGMNVVGLGPGAGPAVREGAAGQPRRVPACATETSRAAASRSSSSARRPRCRPVRPRSPFAPARRSCRPASTSRAAATATSPTSARRCRSSGPGRLRDDVDRLTQDLTHELEDLIRKAPEQWHMMQPNWPADTDLAD